MPEVVSDALSQMTDRRAPRRAVGLPGGSAVVIAGGVLLLLAFLVGYAGARLDSATIGLVLVGLALVACLRSLHRMVGALGRDEVAVAIDGESEFGGSTRRELLEERKRLLRAINELRFDHEMGKLSPADYEAVREGYELRLVEVMRALDSGASLHPELAARLGLAQTDAGDGVGVTKADPPADAGADATSADAPKLASEPATGSPEAAEPPTATPTASEPVAEPSAPPPAEAALPTRAAEPAAAASSTDAAPKTRACAACNKTNDADARFCKHCGKELAA